MRKLTKLAFTLLLILIVHSCQRREEPVNVKLSTQNSKLGKTSGNCLCATRQKSNCTDECTKQFMEDQDIKRFQITWESCDNNDLDGDCRGSQAAQNPSNGLPYVSDVIFCYPDWVNSPTSGCYLQMQIDNLPPCIKCITDFPRCITFKVNCSNVDNGDGSTSYTLSLVAEDPDVTGSSTVDGYEWTLTTVTGDPKIKVCCEKKVGNWNNWYCCTGDIQAL